MQENDRMKTIMHIGVAGERKILSVVPVGIGCNLMQHNTKYSKNRRVRTYIFLRSGKIGSFILG